MGFSVGAIKGSSTTVRPMNYTVSNESAVSDAYTESVQQAGAVGTADRVGATRPVQYPNAKVTDETIDPAIAVEKSRSAGQMLNQVAAKFTGMTTGYNSDSRASGYGMVGRVIDVYA